MMTVQRGFALVELLAALVLLAIVGTTIGRLLLGQQRFYASIHERLAMRSQLRDGGDVLTIALRHAAMQAAPVTLATDTAIELSTTIGAAVVCGSSGAQIDLAPEAPASGVPLSATAVPPDSADDVLVYVAGAAMSPPQWYRARIVDVTTRAASSVCSESPLVGAADLATARVTELTTVPVTGAASGSPVRIIRPARFDVYRAGDGLYYVGYRRCGQGCAGVQPVSGPYGATAGVVSFRYYDVTGSALAPPLAVSALARITRVDVALRATSRGIIDLPGVGRGVARDSVLLSVALRNAP